jgi:hypothetical protein
MSAAAASPALHQHTEHSVGAAAQRINSKPRTQSGNAPRFALEVVVLLLEAAPLLRRVFEFFLRIGNLLLY